MKFDFKNKSSKGRIVLAKRRLTKREFFIVTLFLTITAAYLLYTYMIEQKWQEYKDMKDRYGIVENSKSLLEREYARKDELEEQVQAIEKEIIDYTHILPNYLSQEEEILTLNEIAEKAGVIISKETFSNDFVLLTKDYINGLNTNSNSTEGANALTNENNGSHGNASSNSTSSSNSSNSGNTGTSVKDLINSSTEHLGVVISHEVIVNLEGTFDQIYQFAKEIETHPRRIFIKEANLIRNEDQRMITVFKLLFPAYVKEGKIGDYTIETGLLKEKLNIFEPYEGYISGKGFSTAAPRINPNFDIIIGSYLTNADKVKIKETNSRDTEVGIDQNTSMTGKITLSDAGGGQIRYEYQIENKFYSGTGTFKLQEGKLWLYVYSRVRNSSNDLVEIKMDIINQTGHSLGVVVVNDDTEKPRFIKGVVSGDVTFE